MYSDHRHAQFRGFRDGPGNGVWNIFELQIEKYFAVRRAKFPDKIRAQRGEQLLPYLIEANRFAKRRNQVASIFGRWNIQRDDQSIQCVHTSSLQDAHEIKTHVSALRNVGLSAS